VRFWGELGFGEWLPVIMDEFKWGSSAGSPDHEQEFFLPQRGWYNLELTVNDGAGHNAQEVVEFRADGTADVGGRSAVTTRTVEVEPNPGPGPVRLRLTGMARGQVKIRIIAADGSEVVKMQPTVDGSGVATWDGSGDNGAAVPAGVYFVRAVDAEGRRVDGRIVVTR
jgi:hypothetical protein